MLHTSCESWSLIKTLPFSKCIAIQIVLLTLTNAQKLMSATHSLAVRYFGQSAESKSGGKQWDKLYWIIYVALIKYIDRNDSLFMVCRHILHVTRTKSTSVSVCLFLCTIFSKRSCEETCVPWQPHDISNGNNFTYRFELPVKTSSKHEPKKKTENWNNINE